MRKFPFSTLNVLEFLDTCSSAGLIWTRLLMSSHSRIQDEVEDTPWALIVSGWGSEHTGWWEHAMPLRTSAQKRQMAHIFMAHLVKSQSLYPQSVGWGCLQGKVEKRKRKWIIVDKWYNLHALWGRYCHIWVFFKVAFIKACWEFRQDDIGHATKMRVPRGRI